MPLDLAPAIIGKEFDRSEYGPIPAGELIAFAQALGETDPVYVEPGPELVAHPMYPVRFRGRRFYPENLPAGLLARVQHLCKRAYRILQLSGCARVDLRLDAQGGVYVLEANPNPQLARDEDFAESAAHAGIAYDVLIQRLLGLSLRWAPEQASLRKSR